MIPPLVTDRCGLLPAGIPVVSEPWLPLAWPIQAEPWGLYAAADVPDFLWARAVLRLQLNHPAVPWVRPINTAPAPSSLLFAWGLNRVVQAALLDAALVRTGWDADRDREAAVQWWQTQSDVPEVSRLLAALELIYRGATKAEQDQLSEALGPDVLRAAYQLNMMCIDPTSADRTLLQVQRIAIKVMPEAADQARSDLQLCLSDGRELALL